MAVSVSKDKKRGTWKVYLRYKDWQGIQQVHTKRGFATKKAGQEYEREFLEKKSRNVNMGFNAFVDIYLEDMKPRLKLNTYLTKEHIINSKIRPFFINKNLSEINATDIIQWQNDLLKQKGKNGKLYSPCYSRTIQNQLSAIFNHASTFYSLKDNPCKKVKKIGKSRADNHLYGIWTRDEFFKFSESVMDKRISYMGFSILFWQGLRISELLCLTKADIDFENATMRISKAYQRLEGRDVITPTKTYQTRTIGVPRFLLEDLKEYLESFYKLDDDERIFPKTKSYFNQEMKRGCKLSGVKKIKVHGLRHSAVSLLIYEMDTFDPLAIAERMGHSVDECLKTYSHLYTNKRKKLVNKLDEVFLGVEKECQD